MHLFVYWSLKILEIQDSNARNHNVWARALPLPIKMSNSWQGKVPLQAPHTSTCTRAPRAPRGGLFGEQFSSPSFALIALLHILLGACRLVQIERKMISTQTNTHAFFRPYFRALKYKIIYI